MKYKSKIDLLYTVILTSIPIIGIIVLTTRPVFINWIIMVLCFLFPLFLWKSIYYEISDGYLTARIMILMTKLKISEITSVIETENVWSSYALSIKRLEVKTKFKVIYISPADKEGFINELIRYNPDIKMV